MPPFEPFCGFLERLPTAVVNRIEPPPQPDGAWRLELTMNKVSTRVTWSTEEGFGLYVVREFHSAARPDFQIRDYGCAAAKFAQIVNDFTGARRAPAKR